MSAAYDVAVAGGGPAGLAAAGALARRGRSVVLFERGTFEDPRAGESLGGEVGALLKALGAWDAMGAVLGAQVPFRAVQSAWGGEELVERHALASPLGEGWHVDRARFDAALAEWATSCGATLRTGAGATFARRAGEGFVVEPAQGAPAHCRSFIDASGRGAPAGRLLGERRWLACDRQVAVVARMGGAARSTELLLEAAEEGWWYSAPQPGGALVVTLVTDADLVPAGSRHGLPERFARALARTRHLSSQTSGLSMEGPPRVVRAGSGCLVPEQGQGWCAAGDAAMSSDPLAGDGVARALRSALEVVGERDAAKTGAQRFAAYLDRRDRYYELEARWPDAPFWRRRRPGAWRERPVTLHPEAVLVRSEKPASTGAALAVEPLLPPVVISMALQAAALPQPAHALLARIRAAAPLGDRRLLAGLEALVKADLLRQAAGVRDAGGPHVRVGDAGA